MEYRHIKRSATAIYQRMKHGPHHNRHRPRAYCSDSKRYRHPQPDHFLYSLPDSRSRQGALSSVVVFEAIMSTPYDITVIWHDGTEESIEISDNDKRVDNVIDDVRRRKQEMKIPGLIARRDGQVLGGNMRCKWVLREGSVLVVERPSERQGGVSLVPRPPPLPANLPPPPPPPVSPFVAKAAPSLPLPAIQVYSPPLASSPALPAAMAQSPFPNNQLPAATSFLSVNHPAPQKTTTNLPDPPPPSPASFMVTVRWHHGAETSLSVYKGMSVNNMVQLAFDTTGISTINLVATNRDGQELMGWGTLEDYRLQNGELVVLEQSGPGFPKRPSAPRW